MESHPSVSPLLSVQLSRSHRRFLRAIAAASAPRPAIIAPAPPAPSPTLHAPHPLFGAVDGIVAPASIAAPASGSSGMPASGSGAPGNESTGVGPAAASIVSLP